MRDHLGIYNRGYLPHIDLPWLIQTVRFHIRGALPKSLALSPNPSTRTVQVDEYLDEVPSSTRLSDSEKTHVEDSLLFFDHTRYALIAWAIMPNHIHVCFVQWPGWPLGGLVRSWKAHSGKTIAKKRGTGNDIWERDYFDKAVRSETQLRNTITYIEGNPVKAGLASTPSEWRWSSAWNHRTAWPDFHSQPGVM